jgi:hypothetical protein
VSGPGEKERTVGVAFLKRYKYWVIIGGVVLVGAVYFLLSGSPQQDVLRRVVQAVADEDVRGVMDGIDPDYEGRFGSSREVLMTFVQRAFERYENIKIVVVRFELLEASARSARARVVYKVVGTYRGQRFYFMGGINKTEEIDILFTRRGADWFISGLEYAGDDRQQQRRLEEVERELGG